MAGGAPRARRLNMRAAALKILLLLLGLGAPANRSAETSSPVGGGEEYGSDHAFAGKGRHFWWDRPAVLDPGRDPIRRLPNPGRNVRRGRGQRRDVPRAIRDPGSTCRRAPPRRPRRGRAVGSTGVPAVDDAGTVDALRSAPEGRAVAARHWSRRRPHDASSRGRSSRRSPRPDGRRRMRPRARAAGRPVLVETPEGALSRRPANPQVPSAFAWNPEYMGRNFTSAFRSTLERRPCDNRPT